MELLKLVDIRLLSCYESGDSHGDLQVFEIQKYINELSSGGVEGHAGPDGLSHVREGEGSLSQVGQGHRGNAHSRYQARPAGYSKSTITHVKKLFVQILDKAVELEYLTRNPAARLNVPRNLKKPI